MRVRAGVLAALVLLAGCHRAVGPAPQHTGTASPYVRTLWLPAVGPTPWDWRQLPGHVVLVAFFASWSFPSLAQLPTLEALQKEQGPEGLRIVLVGLDTDGAVTLAPFAEEYASLGIPVLVADAPLREGQSPYGVIPALPATFLLDRQGQVAGAWQGMAGHQALSDAVRTLLKR